MLSYLILLLLALLTAVIGVLVARESAQTWGMSLLTGLGLFLGALTAFAFVV